MDRRLEDEHGLELPDDRPARDVELEHLPLEAPPGAAHRIGPFARAGLGWVQGVESGQERAEPFLELVERAAAQAGEGGGEPAARAAVKPAAPGGKKWSIGHRAVYIPLT